MAMTYEEALEYLEEHIEEGSNGDILEAVNFVNQIYFDGLASGFTNCWIPALPHYMESLTELGMKKEANILTKLKAKMDPEDLFQMRDDLEEALYNFCESNRPLIESIEEELLPGLNSFESAIIKYCEKQK